MKNQIYCDGDGYRLTNIKYLPYGTIGWVKTDNNDVRQCKCVGIIWDSSNDDVDYNKPTYEWKVAGIKEHQFGTPYEIDMGNIYPTEDIAQHSRCHGDRNKDGYLVRSQFSLSSLLVRKYGFDIRECAAMTNAYNTLFKLEAYCNNTNNTITTRRTDFYVKMDKNGIDVVIPMLDGDGDGIRRYPTYDEALKHSKLGKVYTIDDEDYKDEQPKVKTITITIEIDENKLDTIKDIGAVIK